MMTNNFWINALLIGDWFLLGILVIGGIILVWKLGKRGGKILAAFASIIVTCLLIGLLISAVTTRPDGPPPIPMPSVSAS